MLSRCLDLSLIILPLLISLATGQSSSTYSAPAATHTVSVGNGAFRYVPNTTYANPGDVVVFDFYPSNHSVIRAEYTGWSGCGSGGCNPCVPYDLYHSDQADLQFFSGLIDVPSFTSNPPSWNLTINDTHPIFFYCNAPGSCHPHGMVGVINPNDTVSIDKQNQAAVSASFQLNPGDSWPAEGTTPTSSSSPAYSTGGSSSAGSSPNSSSSHGLSGGAIAGIVVGSVAFIAMAGALIWYVSRSHAYKNVVRHSIISPRSDAGESSTFTGPHMSQPPGPNEKVMDPRFSGSTAWGSPQMPEGATFVGYNRQTGAPEFSHEAPGENEVQEMAPPSATVTNPAEIQSPVELEAASRSGSRSHKFWGSSRHS